MCNMKMNLNNKLTYQFLRNSECDAYVSTYGLDSYTITFNQLSGEYSVTSNRFSPNSDCGKFAFVHDSHEHILKRIVTEAFASIDKSCVDSNLKTIACVKAYTIDDELGDMAYCLSPIEEGNGVVPQGYYSCGECEDAKYIYGVHALCDDCYNNTIVPQSALSTSDINRMLQQAKILENVALHEPVRGLGKNKTFKIDVPQAVSHRPGLEHTYHVKSSQSRDRICASRSVKLRQRLMLEPQMYDFMPTLKVGLNDDSTILLDNLVNTLGRLVNDGATVEHQVNIPTIGDIVGGGSTTNVVVKTMVFTVAIFMGFKCVEKTNERPIVACCTMFSALTILYINDNKAMEILNKIKDFFLSGNLQPQGHAENVMDLIVGFMYYTNFKSCKGNVLNDFFKKTADMKKIKNGMEFTFGFVLRYIQSFSNYMTDYFGSERFYLSLDNMPDISIFAEKVSNIVSEFSHGKTLNYSSAEQVHFVYQDGMKLQKSIPNGVEYNDARKLLALAMTELSPIMSRIKRTNLYNNGPRIEPVGVFLTGPPGVGKTTALTPMLLAVTANVLPEEKLADFEINHCDFIYNRISENEFFDSYTGQFNCVFDDLGQVKDVAGVSNNAYMEVIRMINSNNMDLHMANLEDKGNVNFRSNIVWATSNVNKFRLNSIIRSDALTRRFKCSYIVYPCVGFREDENESDVHKMRLRKGVVIKDFNHIEFKHYDSENGVIVDGKPMSIYDVIEEITSVYKSTQYFGRDLLSTHQSFKQTFINRRKNVNKEESIMDSFLDMSIKTLLDGIEPQGDSDEYEQVEVFNYTYDELIDKFGMPADMASRHAGFQTRSQVEAWYQLYMFQRNDNLRHEKLQEAIFLHQSGLKERAKLWLSSNSYLKISASVASVCGALALGYTCFNSFFSSDPQSSSRVSHRPKGDKAIINRHRGNRVFNVNRTPQLTYDSTLHDVLKKVHRRSMYTIKVHGDVKHYGYITFFKGHDCFMPLHFAEKLLLLLENNALPEGDPVEIAQVGNPLCKFIIDLKQVQWFYPESLEGNDVVFARFPDVLPNAPDLTKYFLDDFSHCGAKFTGALLIPSGCNYNMNTTDVFPIQNLDYGDYSCAAGFKYHIPTVVGDCGSLLGIANPSTRSEKIIGFHVAGDKRGGVGYSVRVTKSMIVEYYEMFDEPIVADESAYYEEEVLSNKSIEPQGFKVLYEDVKPNLPMKTSIIPSPLHNSFCETKCKPAYLRKFKNECGIEIDPWALARASYRKDTHLMNLDVLTSCSQSYFSNVMRQSTNEVSWAPKVFSFEDAVRGVPAVNNCEGIPRQTSPGYPFVLNIPSGHKGKSHFFGKEGDYDFSSVYCEELRMRVCNIVEQARKGNRLKHVYMDFLKDERRPIAKANSGKTRLVSASPVDHLIAMRMYFMDFVRWYMNNKMSNGSAVGINPYSSDWELLSRNLNSGGKVLLKPSLIAGDFKAFDGSISRQVQLTFLSAVNQWYDDGNDRIRAVLFEDVCNSKHMYDGVIYEWPGSNPSGCFLTTILNSYCNNVILRYASMVSFSSLHYSTRVYPKFTANELDIVLRLFEKHVYVIAFGDDNLLAVGDPCKEWVNQSSLTDAFSLFGFIYTMEDKDAEIETPFRTIDQITFLKRSWSYNKDVNTFVAPLSMDTILEMCQWTKNKDRNFDNVKINVDNVLKELSFHGPAVYNNWAPKILSSARKNLDYITTITGYKQALSLQLSRDEIGC